MIAMTVAFAAVAIAGPSSQERADALFKKGKTLLGQQQYKEACAAFEESNKLDAQVGTVLNLALCFEGWGKVASAQHWYLEAEKLAAIKSDAKRGAAARQRADALTPRIPKIRFAGLPDILPADLVVTLDGGPLGLDALRAGVSVDPGPHAVAYTVEGAKKTIKLEVSESTSKEIKLDLPAPEVVQPDHSGSGSASGSGGGRDTPLGPPRVALAFKARSDYNSAFDAHCDATGCDDTGFKQTHDARSTANIATVICAIGGAAVVTGVVVWLTAPRGRAPVNKEHVWIRPVVTDGGAAVVIGGSL